MPRPLSLTPLVSPLNPNLAPDLNENDRSFEGLRDVLVGAGLIGAGTGTLLTLKDLLPERHQVPAEYATALATAAVTVLAGKKIKERSDHRMRQLEVLRGT